jgi:uncharacterized membrane protein YgcG
VRLFGNLNLQATNAFVKYAQGAYDPMQGASSMHSVANAVNGQFVQQMAINKLRITDAEKARIRSDQPPKREGEAGYTPEPVFWAHFDEEEGTTKMLRVKPEDPPKTTTAAASKAPRRPDSGFEGCGGGGGGGGGASVGGGGSSFSGDGGGGAGNVHAAGEGPMFDDLSSPF